MPSFLHTADIHLDSSVSAHLDSDGSKMRRSELLRSFSGIIDAAGNLDFLLIAGDLFDDADVSYSTVAFLKRRFSEIPNTKIVIAAGNHDPFSHNSVYAKEDFGENVYILSTDGECLEFPEQKTRVFGASFKNEFSDGRLFVPPQSKGDGFFNILLLHADLDGSLDRYNPIDKDFILKSGADYAALGHIHKRSEVMKIENTYYAYSGSPEGRGFDECGDLGCYIGNYENERLDIHFKKNCIRRMIKTDVFTDGATDIFDIENRIKTEIDKCGTSDDMFRIVLKGRTDLSFSDIEEISDRTGSYVFYAEVLDETLPNIDFDYYAGQNNICGAFIRNMREKIKNSDEADAGILEQALKLGVEALLGGEF